MIAFFKRIAAWLKSRKVELGLGVRVTVAAMGALVIALAFGLQAAAMGGADLDHRDADERRPIAEGDPRLSDRHASVARSMAARSPC